MDFARKARWVLDGHKMPDPVGSIFAGVASRESMLIAFTYAALNVLDILAADIRYSYLEAPSSQRDYIVCGPKFGIENLGCVVLIHRALYGKKSAGKDFQNNLRMCMHHLNLKSSPTNPDVWMQPSKKADAFPCYDYVLLYTDDTLLITENAKQILRGEIGKYVELKEELVGPPKISLGGHVQKVKLTNAITVWSFSSSQYVSTAVENVEEYLKTNMSLSWKLPAKAEMPMQESYWPEVDVPPEPNHHDAS